MNKITYSEIGDCLISNLCLPAEKENIIIGKYGRARKEFLKNHHKGFYSRLVLSCTLNEHLAETDRDAKRLLPLLANIAMFFIVKYTNSKRQKAQKLNTNKRYNNI